MRPIAWAIAIVILRFSGARTVDEAASALRLARGDHRTNRSDDG